MLLVALALAVALVEAIGAVLVLVLVKIVTQPSNAISLPLVGSLQSAFPGASTSQLRTGVSIAVVVFFLLRSVVIAGQGYLRAKTVERTSAELSDHLLRGYLAMPYLAHTQLNSATLVRNTYVATQQFGGQVLKPLVGMLAELIVAAVLIAVLLVLAPQATLLAAAFFSVTLFVLIRLVQPALRRLGRQAQDSRSAGLKAVTQALVGVRDIRLVGREREFADVYRAHRDRVARAEYLRGAASEVPRGLIETTLVTVIVVLLLLAGEDNGDGSSIMSTLGVFAYAGVRLQPSLTKIIDGFNQLKFGTAVLDDLHDDRVAADAALRDFAAAARSTGPTFSQTFELRDVTLTYPGADAPALDRVSFAVPFGSFVGVCGPTGGGKSTLLDVVAGLLTVDSGEVTVDGAALGPFPRWWHEQLGVVSQSIFLTDDTVRANIALGVPDEEIDEQRLLDCVQRAQLGEVVAGLPDGLATVVGERGQRLSGGQRQRVAVARALYRDPPVILMDEGTSALDTATETALVAAIGDLRADRTLIAIAHRISTVKDADTLLVIDQGRVVAQGTYQELLASNATFQSLVAQ